MGIQEDVSKKAGAATTTCRAHRARIPGIFGHSDQESLDSLQADVDAESVVRFSDVKQVLITASRLLTPAKAFLQLEGSGNAEIVVDGGDLSRAQAPLAFKDGADKSSVRLRE